ncbi:MAG: hypothetical protein KC656_18385 [Myxococcales bacterium]|nr:hypothetical protein [Myxococcales bacterium]
MGIEVGDVVVDNYGNEGLVVREEARPPAGWLRSQRDTRVMRLGLDERWLGVMPFTGGLVVAPASLCARLRAAERDDVVRAAARANRAALEALSELFPAWVP